MTDNKQREERQSEIRETFAYDDNIINALEYVYPDDPLFTKHKGRMCDTTVGGLLDEGNSSYQLTAEMSRLLSPFALTRIRMVSSAPTSSSSPPLPVSNT